MENTQFKAGLSKKLSAALAAAGAVGCVISFFLDKGQLAYSYLTSLVFFVCISLGGVFFVLIHHLTRAGWSVVVRRIAENIAANLQWLWVLFLPLLAFSMHDLFHWTHNLEGDTILQAKTGYLNIPFFILRTCLYFALWFFTARFFLKMSVKQDKTGDKSLTLSLQKWAPLALIGYAASETFFSFDWMMSLSPHWYSTIYGVYFFSCSAVGIYAMLVIIAFLLQRKGYLRESITKEHYHDLGKLLFGFNMFWAYIAFCQFLLIWYGNLGEETVFYHTRANGGWKTLSVAIPILHFAVPFFFMISRNVKRRTFLMFLCALWLIVMNFIDIYWLIMPNHSSKDIHLTLADISSLLFVGGLFFMGLIRYMEKSALVPVKDPRLGESLKFVNS